MHTDANVFQRAVQRLQRPKKTRDLVDVVKEGMGYLIREEEWQMDEEWVNSFAGDVHVEECCVFYYEGRNPCYKLYMNIISKEEPWNNRDAMNNYLDAVRKNVKRAADDAVKSKYRFKLGMKSVPLPDVRVYPIGMWYAGDGANVEITIPSGGTTMCAICGKTIIAR